MTAMKVRTFVHKEGEFNEVEEMTVNTTDSIAMKRVRELHKKASVLMVPVNEEGALDVAGIEALLTPGRRSASDWSDEMVVMAHDLKANTSYSDQRITMEIFKNFDVEVTTDSLKKTLKQEANTGATVPEGLRETVREMMEAGGGDRRKRMTEEVEEAIVTDMHDNGLTGVAAGLKYGFSSSACNNAYRKVHGYRKK